MSAALSAAATSRCRPILFGPVDRIVVHPLYKPTDAGSPDLAMLKLAKPLPDRFIPRR